MKALEIINLNYAYPDGTRALDGISLAVEAGERLGIIGPNGAGKSTLFLHLNGLLPEHINGESPIRVLDLPVTKANLPVIRAKVGLLFQDPDDQLFCPSVLEDVAFGPRQMGLPEEQVIRKATEALERVGLRGFERRPPHHLSHGEKRRVCLAGLLACEPQILVLDEPTSDLDPRGRRELKELLRALPITQIIATHDLELVAELCGRVVVLDRGRVVTEGPSRSVMSDEELMLAHGLEKPHILTHHHPHWR